MMDEQFLKDAKILNDALNSHFDLLGWSEEDKIWARDKTTQLGMVFALAPSIPITDKRFPEILRCLANAQELIKELYKKRNSL